MVVDTHVHLSGDDPGGDRLVAEADRLGIDKLVIFSTSENGKPGNEGVMAAARRHPDRLIPFAYLRLGKDTPKDVEWLSDTGFKGFKIIRPASSYHDRRYFPLYEVAEARGKILLFHLGIVAVNKDDKLYDVDSSRMRPIYLDSICRTFPNLVVWGAHLGNPWYEEAAMLCRWHVNLYFDLSGSSLKAKPPQFFGQLLWWEENKQYGDRLGRGPWDKILFGTDVSIDLMADVMNDYRRLLDMLGLSEEKRAAVMGNTAARLLGVC